MVGKAAGRREVQERPLMTKPSALYLLELGLCYKVVHFLLASMTLGLLYAVLLFMCRIPTDKAITVSIAAAITPNMSKG